MDKKRIKIIITSIVIGIIALIVLATIVFRKPSCQLVQERPTFNDYNKLHNIADSDYRSLANFAGFLKYRFHNNEDDKMIYLPLNVNSIKWIPNIDIDMQLFKLYADCATITLTINTIVDDKKNKIYQSEGIKVDLSIPNGENRSCDIISPFIKYRDGKHYSCKKLVSYGCYARINDELVMIAYLELNDFEFEINGLTEKIKNSLFSTDPDQC